MMVLISWLVLMAKKHWRKILIGAGVVVIAVFFILLLRGCSSPTPAKLDEAAVQENVERIKEGNRKQAEAVAVEIATKQAAIDDDLSGNLKAIEEKESQAKEKFGSMTNEELAKWFEEQAK